jgi:hypothetical protein
MHISPQQNGRQNQNRIINKSYEDVMKSYAWNHPHITDMVSKMSAEVSSEPLMSTYYCYLPTLAIEKLFKCPILVITYMHDNELKRWHLSNICVNYLLYENIILLDGKCWIKLQ